MGGDPFHFQRVARRVVGEDHAGQGVTRHVGRVGAAASAEFARAVVLRGGGVVVAGHHVGAAFLLELVTGAVAIGVVEAVSVAVEVVHAPEVEGILAGAVIRVGLGVVVARRRVRTAAVGARAVVGVGAGVEVVGLRVRATGEQAGAVVVVGTAVVVGGLRIRAARVEAGTIVDGRHGAVVAGLHVGAACEDTGTVVEFRRSIVVHGVRIGAAPVADGDGADHAERGLVGHGAVVVVHARNREGEGAEARALRRSQHGGDGEGLGVVKRQAGQLVRRGVDVVESAHVDPHHGCAHLEVEQARVVIEAAHFDDRVGFDATGIEIHATAIVVGGGVVVVPGEDVGTTGDFILVAHPVAVGVVQTVAGTILEIRRIRAASIVVVGGLVIVAGRRIRAASVLAGAVVGGGAFVVVVRGGVGTSTRAGSVGPLETQVETEVALPHPVFEDLNEERARNLSVRRQLCEQHLVVIARHTVAVVLRHEPCAARRIVHLDVAAALKRQHPPLRGALHRAHLALVRTAVGLLRNADGDPAVELELREEAEQQRVHCIGGGSTERVLIEGRGGGQFQREDGIATHGRHNVVGVHAIHEDMVRGHAGERAGIVFSDHLYGQAVAGDLGMRKGHRGQAKEKSDQTVHVSTIWVGQS